MNISLFITSFKIKWYLSVHGSPMAIYFNSLIVSTTRSHKKLWVGLSEWSEILLHSRLCELVNIQSFALKITLLSLTHTRFLLNLSIKPLIRLGLASHCLSTMFGMASSVNLTLFVAYLIDRDKVTEITYVPQSVSRRTCCGKLASSALCSRFVSNHANEFYFAGTNTSLSTGRPICTIISGTIDHFTRLTMIISNS